MTSKTHRICSCQKKAVLVKSNHEGCHGGNKHVWRKLYHLRSKEVEVLWFVVALLVYGLVSLLPLAQL